MAFFASQQNNEYLGQGRQVNEDAFHQKANQSLAGHVKMISGCKDDQCSADVGDVSQFGLPDSQGAGGALTESFILAFKPHDSPTYTIVLKRCREFLKTNQFAQIPQLSSSRPVKLQDPFALRHGNGNAKSLFIGINYVGQKGQLSGCHNDVTAMKHFVMSQGFTDTPETCMTLLDDGQHNPPTYANIVSAMNWLVQGAQNGDDLFFHYSGHGGQLPDDNGDEESGFDETLVPVDYATAGQIRDDDIHDILAKPVPEGAHLFAVMDCCHSGTVMDLPYTLKLDDEVISQVEAGHIATTQPNLNFQFRLQEFIHEIESMRASGMSRRQIKKHLHHKMNEMLYHPHFSFSTSSSHPSHETHHPLHHHHY